jgi:hypothetical protein
MTCCVLAMSSVKFLTVAGRSRTAHLLLIAFVFIFKQSVNMETVHFVSICDKYLTSYGRDQQRRASLRAKCIFFAFNIPYFMIIRSDMFEYPLFTRMFNFNHHNSLSCLKTILRKRHLFFETSFGCLAITGLTHTKCFSVVTAEPCPCRFAFFN